MRLILLRALLFALPFVVYYAFVVLARHTARSRAAVFMLLAATGLLLVAGSFVWLGLTEGEGTAGVYVPPKLVNGHVVPAHVEKTPP